MTADRPPGYSREPPTMAVFWIAYLLVGGAVVGAVAGLGGLPAGGLLAAVLIAVAYVLRRWGT